MLNAAQQSLSEWFLDLLKLLRLSQVLEANDLADEDSDISMLQIVERSLGKQKRRLASQGAAM